MTRSRFGGAGLSFGLFLCCVASSASGESLTFTLGDHGIKSLSYAGKTLVKTEPSAIEAVTMRRPDGTTYLSHTPTPTFTRNGNSYTIQLPWGTMWCTYSQSGDSLIIDLSAYNASKTDTLVQCEAGLSESISPTPDKVRGWTFCVDGLWALDTPVIDAAPPAQPGVYFASGGGPAIACIDIGFAIQALGAVPGLGADGSPTPARDASAAFQYWGKPDMICNARASMKMIGPGQTNTRRFYVRFAPPGTDPFALCSDLLEKYGAAKPQQLQWDDRRPILMECILANGIAATIQNPRRYQTGQDLRTEAGKKAFREELMKRADGEIAHLKNTDAQGIVFWSTEGIEEPWAMYGGDPTRITLAPEMEYKIDGVPTIDAFLKKFTDAGYRVGHCLRPQDMRYIPCELGTQFKPTVDGTITKLRVFSSFKEIKGVHTARIWSDSDGKMIGGPYQWTYGGSDADGWVELDIPDVAVTANTQYTVSVSTTEDNCAFAFTQPPTDAWVNNGAGHLTYQSRSVYISDKLGPRPTEAHPIGNFLRDVVFVPAGDKAEENLFGAASPTVTDYKPIFHHDMPDPAQNLIDKINYCKKRWGSTLFYVDSTYVINSNVPPGSLNGETEGGNAVISSDCFKRVQEACPDVLVMPENQCSNDYPYGAPFDDASQGVHKTPRKVTAIWPGAFTCIRAWSNQPTTFDDYVVGARRGDIFFFQPADDDEAWLNKVYKEAGHVPTSRITAPANNSSLSEGKTLTIQAAATDSDGKIDHVDFFASSIENGRVLLGKATSAPYQFAWDQVPAGRYVLSARSVDNSGLEMWSSQIVVNVQATHD